jgi:hypothetical protein
VLFLDIQELFSELMGKRTGCALGKGGSMHLYHREHNFWGGWGIVGTPPPLGSGLAFAHKYSKKPNVVVTIYGDGAGNQVSITSRLLGLHMFILLVASTSCAHERSMFLQKCLIVCRVKSMKPRISLLCGICLLFL